MEKQSIDIDQYSSLGVGFHAAKHLLGWVGSLEKLRRKKTQKHRSRLVNSSDVYVNYPSTKTEEALSTMQDRSKYPSLPDGIDSSPQIFQVYSVW